MRKFSEKDEGCTLPETLPSSHVTALDSRREHRMPSVETGHPLLWNRHAVPGGTQSYMDISEIVLK